MFFTIAPTGSTSLKISLGQVQREGIVQLGFDSFQVNEGSTADRLMIEPTAVYAWSAIFLSGSPNPGLARLLKVIGEVSQELHWMHPPVSADVWLPADDTSSTLPDEILTALRGNNVQPHDRG